MDGDAGTYIRQNARGGAGSRRYKFVVCKVLQREAYYCAARSCNEVDVVLMEQGLHDRPDDLRSSVLRELECVEDIQGRRYDALILGYGLCSNGLAGVKAKLPVVVPRAHDCATLLLGDKDVYRRYFDDLKGVYWYSPGWIECNLQPGRERFEKLEGYYREKYGEDNAAFLMETERGWISQYNWAIYIDWAAKGPGGDERSLFACSDEYKAYTKACADYLGWGYKCVKGSARLMEAMTDSDWVEFAGGGDEQLRSELDDRFVVVRPGEVLAEDVGSESIICSESESSEGGGH